MRRPACRWLGGRVDRARRADPRRQPLIDCFLRGTRSGACSPAGRRGTRGVDLVLRRPTSPAPAPGAAPTEGQRRPSRPRPLAAVRAQATGGVLGEPTPQDPGGHCLAYRVGEPAGRQPSHRCKDFLAGLVAGHCRHLTTRRASSPSPASRSPTTRRWSPPLPRRRGLHGRALPGRGRPSGPPPAGGAWLPPDREEQLQWAIGPVFSHRTGPSHRTISRLRWPHEHDDTR
jgi:hypothetical protein